MVTFLKIVQLLVSIGLIVVVLFQESKEEGLSALGGSGSMFFNKTSGAERVLQQATKYLAITFILLSILLSIL